MVETDTGTWDRIVNMIAEAESAGNDSKYGMATLLRERAREIWANEYNSGMLKTFLYGIIIGATLCAVSALLGMIA